MCIGQRFLPAMGKEREGHSEDEVGEGEGEIGFESSIGEGVNFLGGGRDFGNGDVSEKGGVFESGRGLAC